MGAESKRSQTSQEKTAAENGAPSDENVQLLGMI